MAHYRIPSNPLKCSACGTQIKGIEVYVPNIEGGAELYGYGLIRISNITGKGCCSFSEGEFHSREEAEEAAKDTFKLWKADYRIWRAQQIKQEAEDRLWKAE
jgi:hypothetical protein